MKVGEQLMYLAQLKGLSKAVAKDAIQHWLEKFQIEDWIPKKVQELSKGMQQKIQFIATVIHRPKLLILDEPFSGLDPINTNLIKDEIRQLNKEGTSIIFSTHRMEQVEEICEQIVLINKGENVLEGSVKAIKQRFKENLFKIEYEGQLPAGMDQFDLDTASFKVLSKQEGEIIVQVEQEEASNALLHYLLKNGVYIHSFNEILPTINQIFIKTSRRNKR